MIVQVIVKAPFWHKFKEKNTFYASQDVMRINTNTQEGVEEFKYIISEIYPYKNFVHIDKSQVERFINRHRFTEDDYNAYSNVESPQSFLKSPEYIGDNPYVNPVRHKKNNNEESEEQVAQTENTEHIQSQGELNQEEQTTNDTSETNYDDVEIEKQKRKLELENSHYTKVKSIAEDDYDIEYSNKLETIKRILDREFPNVE